MTVDELIEVVGRENARRLSAKLAPLASEQVVIDWGENSLVGYVAVSRAYIKDTTDELVLEMEWPV